MKERLNKIKEWIDEIENPKTIIEDWGNFNLNHPFTGGFISGATILWFAIVINSFFHKGEKLEWIKK